jgi:hypothetical protein
VRDLRGDVLDRLRSHTALTDRLEQVDSIDDGTDVIVPSPFLGDGDQDAALSVAVITGSSTRENLQERKNMTVQTELRVRSQTLKARGVVWHDELLDEVGAVLTTQVGGWTALGETGGTPEPLWDESLNKYRSVQRFDIESWG